MRNNSTYQYFHAAALIIRCLECLTCQNHCRENELVRESCKGLIKSLKSVKLQLAQLIGLVQIFTNEANLLDRNNRNIVRFFDSWIWDVLSENYTGSWYCRVF